MIIFNGLGTSNSFEQRIHEHIIAVIDCGKFSEFIFLSVYCARSIKMATCLRASVVDFASLSSDNDLEIELIE